MTAVTTGQVRQLRDKVYEIEGRVDALAAATGDPDPWHNFGGMSNGWSKNGTDGIGAYRYDYDRRSVIITIKNINPGTISDTIVIWSSANGLAAGYRPLNPKRIAIESDVLALSSSGGGGRNEGACLIINTDGSIEAFGMGLNTSRLDGTVMFPLDI